MDITDIHVVKVIKDITDISVRAIMDIHRTEGTAHK
jgi:hypothetical protein